VSEYFCLFISALPFFWLLIVVFVAGGIKNNKKGKKKSIVIQRESRKIRGQRG